jgi:cytochrome c peroxidase
MAKSTGVFGETGIRNAPALYNLAWKPAFMWDGGIVHLEFQPLAPLTDQKEMAMSIPLVLERIKQNDEYISLFFDASGSTEISSQLVFQAFARFLASLVSDDSNYDQFIRGNANALSNSELKGLKLFRKLCESCHKEPLFSDFSFRNNGIEPLASDSGRVRITLLPQDRFKFLVPSLRNIGFSAPYMHDGRFKTLDEVIEHYASHEYYSGGADEKLPRQTISADEKEALKAFLLSLNDYSFVNNKAFSEF